MTHWLLPNCNVVLWHGSMHRGFKNSIFTTAKNDLRILQTISREHSSLYFFPFLFHFYKHCICQGLGRNALVHSQCNLLNRHRLHNFTFCTKIETLKKSIKLDVLILILQPFGILLASSEEKSVRYKEFCLIPWILYPETCLHLWHERKTLVRWKWTDA